jgi:hypothetical protein
MEADMKRRFRASNCDLTPGAIGCALSHVAVCQLGLREGHDSILIFEDDALIEADFGARFATAHDALPPGDWDILLLGWHDKGGSSATTSSELKRVGNFYNAHAYEISREGMRKLVAPGSIVPICEHYDVALSHLAVSAAKCAMRIYGVTRVNMFQSSLPGGVVESDINTIRSKNDTIQLSAETRAERSRAKEGRMLMQQDRDRGVAVEPGVEQTGRAAATAKPTDSSSVTVSINLQEPKLQCGLCCVL